MEVHRFTCQREETSLRCRVLPWFVCKTLTLNSVTSLRLLFTLWNSLITSISPSLFTHSTIPYLNSLRWSYLPINSPAYCVNPYMSSQLPFQFLTAQSYLSLRIWTYTSAAFGIAIYRLWIRTPFKSYEKGQAIYSVNISAPKWRIHPKHIESWGANWLWFGYSIHECFLSTWHVPLPSHLDSPFLLESFSGYAIWNSTPPQTDFLWTFLCLAFSLAHNLPAYLFHLSYLLSIFITKTQAPRRQVSLFTTVSAVSRSYQALTNICWMNEWC